MKKLADIAFGLMATCLSAVTVASNVPVVEIEKIVLNAPASFFDSFIGRSFYCFEFRFGTSKPAM
jgi:hypothetical protein